MLQNIVAHGQYVLTCRQALSSTFEQCLMSDIFVCMQFNFTSVWDVIKSLTTGPINGDSPAAPCATAEGNVWCIWRAV